MKLKRSVVAQKYQDQISQFYTDIENPLGGALDPAVEPRTETIPEDVPSCPGRIPWILLK